jgi:alanine dehydrogenase
MSESGKGAQTPTLFLTDSDVEHLSSWEGAVHAIRVAYEGEMSDRRNPGRIFASSDREWIRIMPSVPSSGMYFGYKSITGVAADGMRVAYLISLFSKETGDLVALLDGNRVTGLRTAATTAVGAEKMTPTSPVTLGIIGSGFEARSHALALSRVLNLAGAKVYSPTEQNRLRFASDISNELGIPVVATESAESAVLDADLILCAARSADETPTIQAEWVGPHATVISIGSTTPAQRELPAELLARAHVIVADTLEEVLHGSGDLIDARKQGIDVDSKTVALSEVVSGRHAVDVESGIRIYKSTGSGIQDIVVAEMLVNRAKAMGIGTELGVGIVTTRK